jgi:hypothetical protein
LGKKYITIATTSPFFFFIIFKASLKKYQEYYSSLLQLKPYKIVEAGGLAQKKTGLIFIFHQNFGKNMLPWQTMTICVKHFVNIPDIFFNSLKIII